MPSGSARGASGLLAACAASLSLLVAFSPIAPCIDWPQHLALSATLMRLLSGEPGASAIFAINGATHNAGAHYFVALLGRAVGVEAAGALFLALCPPLFLLGAYRLLRARGLPGERALFLVPSCLGFSFGWGFGNFCMATALSWLLLSSVVEQVERPSWPRALWLGAGSLLVGATHVMGMLLLALTAASAGIEVWARRGGARKGVGGLAGLAAAGAPLLAGCAWDLRVVLAHLGKDASSYSTPALTGVDEPGILRKAGLFGALVSGLFGTYADTALAWASVAALLWAATRAARAPGAGQAERAARGGPLLAPFVVLLGFYFLVPSVFANTHLVFQRSAQWALAASLCALPLLPSRDEARLGRAGAAVAAAYALVLAPIHLGAHALEARRASEVIAAVPRGARVVGVIEDARTWAVRMPVFTHVAALAVARGAAEDGFSFARWMGLPVVYRPGQAPPYPEPSWEHDGTRFDPSSALARRFPWVVVRTRWQEEPDASLSLRLFGPDGRARLVARRGGWALFDASLAGPERLFRPLLPARGDVLHLFPPVVSARSVRTAFCRRPRAQQGERGMGVSVSHPGVRSRARTGASW